MTTHRGYAEGPYGQIHYRDTGEGVALLLFHQSPMSHRQYDSVYDLLHDRGIRAIGVDTPGFGMSDPPDFVPTIQDYARIAPALLDHLGIERAFALGHHTGAQVATEVAALVPDRIMGLILNGPTPFSDDARATSLKHVEINEKGFKAQPDGMHLAKAFKSRMTFANKDTKWPLTTRYIAEQFGGLGPFWYGHHAAFVYDHAASIKTISHPTLILTNTGDQIYDLAQETREMRPDFAYAEIEGGGIDIVDEKPDEWVEAVTAFIGELYATAE
ncbi:alpha/beta hydrolase [Parasphingopyxis algicola]|uniref:alpha/beta fold hydrolase n=1 Tax=Parasphingopyxis algicola TaxID=2026624 RepID=UPI0015A1E35F|nr:alpha/beta hydrolase [Parasphingopyxis algicola]QLC26349.1 alpha/beta hydrolase [Parasphingopyxis algicola]